MASIHDETESSDSSSLTEAAPHVPVLLQQVMLQANSTAPPNWAGISLDVIFAADEASCVLEWVSAKGNLRQMRWPECSMTERHVSS